MVGSAYDPNNDQQSSADSDLLGNSSSAMLQAQTASVSGDTVYYYRVRVGSLTNGNGSSSFYLALDLNGTGVYPTADMFVEAKYAIIGGQFKRGEVNFHKADFLNGNTGFSPSTTSWLSSSTDENNEYTLVSGTSGSGAAIDNNNAIIFVEKTNTDIDGDGNLDYWATFGFTLSQLNAWAKVGINSGSTVVAANNIVSTTVTGTSALALFAFTSTSQTSNGDIAGVNDRTADLTQSWSDLGLVINTTLDNLGSGAPASPTVNRLTTADTTPVVTGTAKLPSGDTLAVVINGTSYTPTLTQIGTTDTYNWAVQVTSPLTSNTYDVAATTSRTSGGSTLTASDLTSGELVVNTSIPNQTPTIIAYGDDVTAQTGDFGSGSRTNDTTPLIKGVLDAPLDAGDVVRIYRSTDNGSFVLLTGNATVSGTSWTFQDGSLSNGSSYTYKAVVYDGSNEGSSSGLFTLNIDTSAPTVTLAIANYTDNVGASTGNFLTGSTTDDSTPLLNGTFSTSGATPPLASGEKIEVLRGGVLVGYGQVLPTVDTTSGSITGYTWTFQESELNNGTYSYTARIVDGAGNLGSTSTAFTLTVSQPLDVNDITVNEASAYAVFTVTGTASATVTLALAAITATASSDYSSTLQWSSDGATWADYSSGVTLSGFTKFYVRTAITNDSTYEGPETFKLTATAGTVSASGTATIRDDGTGAVYTGTVTSGTPATSGTADDDRTVSVSAYSTPVNEASDYAFFTVTGVAGEQIKLDVLDVNDSGSGQTANVGTAPSTYYSLNGGLTWTAYTGSAIAVPSGGSFKVRVDITAEQDSSPEGTEKFSLKAYYDSNAAKSASAEVTISDTGTGDIYLADGALDTATSKDYDVAAPTQTVVISSMEKDTGSSSTDFITKDGTATRAVTGTISAVLGANEVV